MSTLPMGQRLVITKLGEDPLDAYEHHARLEDQPAPDPATLGPRDAIIRVGAAAVGWVDLIMASGQYQHVPTPPYTPGLEYAGTIAWLGTEVTGMAVGDRVLVDPFVAGPRSSGAYRNFGGFATYAIAPASAVLPLPAALSLDEACNLIGNYETAYHCLVTRGKLAAGETVMIHGASGATGLAAVHLAKLLGATVIATGRSPDKLAIVREHGADHVIVTAELATLREQVKALTGGRGVDVVYDGVGGEISAESLRCMRFGARFLIVGWAATPFVARQGRSANVLPTNLIMMKGIDVLGCPTVISTINDPSLRPPRLAQILAWVDAGKLHPYVSRRYPLADWKAALLAKWRGEFVGGAVLYS